MAKEQICNSDLCTGCSACANICPKDAIVLSEDESGYIHPKIDPELCIDCNMCEKVCPVIHPVLLHAPQSTLAVVGRNESERRSSSSGGAASVISRRIIKEGGVVYGCAQENYRTIRHVRVDDNEGVDRLKGSKYVQSRINLIFRDLKKDLLDERTVLFVGTPCQVAGLRNFLRRDFENLYTVDLICHGVPSQQMLRKNLEAVLPLEHNPEDIVVKFRWKASYGIQFGMQAEDLRSGRILYQKSLPDDPYILAFFTGFSFRENCHTCPYSRTSRTGDVTIGDFWRLGAHAPSQFRIKDGVSLLLVNTPKGGVLMSRLKDKFIIEERSLAEAVAGNLNLHTASPRPANKSRFLSVYRSEGLGNACKTVISRAMFRRLELIEWIKRQKRFVSLFKKIRLIINKSKS